MAYDVNHLLRVGDAKTIHDAVQGQVDDLKSAVNANGSLLGIDIRQKLLYLLEHAVYTDGDAYEQLSGIRDVWYPLPSAYQAVEWVGSTGGSQYMCFSTIKPSSFSDLSQYSIDVSCQVEEWNNVNNTNIFVSFGSDAGTWLGYNNSIGKICMGTNSGCYFTDDTPFTRHTYHIYYADNTAYTVRDDGASISRAVTLGTYPQLCLFSAKDASLNSPVDQSQFRGKFRIYSFDVSKNGSKVIGLIPCYRKSDGVIGFYDYVRHIFCINDGGTTFVKGDDV